MGTMNSLFATSLTILTLDTRCFEWALDVKEEQISLKNSTYSDQVNFQH